MVAAFLAHLILNLFGKPGMDSHCHSLRDSKLHHPALASIAERHRTSRNLHHAWLVLDEAPDGVWAQMPNSAKFGRRVVLVRSYGISERLRSSKRAAWTIHWFITYCAHADAPNIPLSFTARSSSGHPEISRNSFSTESEQFLHPVETLSQPRPGLHFFSVLQTVMSCMFAAFLRV
jgi:hypothetical protein